MIIGDWVADLHILVVFARCKNMIEAAAELKMSQGSVSIRLKGLEEKVEQPIFEMVGKKKVLTPFGMELARLARENFERFDRELTDVTHYYASATSIPIRIGCRKEIFDRIVSGFKIENPLIFSDMGNTEIVEGLINRTIDLGITHRVPNSPDLIAKKLFTDHVCICAHKKLEPEFDNPEWLRHTPILTYKVTDPPYVEPFLAQFNLTLGHLRVAGTCESWTALRVMVEEGKGFALMPSHFGGATAQVRAEVIDRAILPEQVFHTIYRKTSALRKVLNHLKIST